MAIPAIAPYPMPPEAELPKNKVAWEADPDRCVLLIHDMQQYFLRAFTPEKSPFTELVDNIRSLKAHCAERGVPGHLFRAAQRADAGAARIAPGLLGAGPRREGG